MADYGSVSQTQSFVRHMPFDQPNNPATADVTEWLDSCAAQLNAWLAEAGYVTPVGIVTAKTILDRYANLGAAGYAELSLRSSGDNDADENRRENKFLAEFYRAKAWIQTRALSALGVPQVEIGNLAAQAPAFGIIIAGTAADTTQVGRPPDWRPR